MICEVFKEDLNTIDIAICYQSRKKNNQTNQPICLISETKTAHSEREQLNLSFS